MNKKNTKRALFSSVVCLILCLAMLAGSTFAWFTDSVTSGINNIISGVLDVEVTHTNNHVTDETVNLATDLFTVEAGKTVLWEPGVVVWENLTVKNVGNLAFQYLLSVNFEDLNDLNGHKLSEALQVGIVPGGVTKTEREDVVAEVASWQSLASFTEEGILLPNNSVPKDPTKENVGSRTYGLVIWWQPSDRDNDWNTVSDNGVYNTSDGNPLGIELGIELIANQYTYENDSFDDQYDADLSGVKYSVVFDTNGGTGVETQTVAENDVAVAPANPTKPGHTFAGWKLNGADYDFATPVTGNITLVAQWTVNSYSLTFDVDGVLDTKDVPYGTDVAEPLAPTKANYNFAGWSDGTQIVVFPYTMPATNVTLTATWVRATSNLTWNDENGSEIQSGTYFEGDPIVHPAAPAKEGHTHTGWTPALTTVPVDDVVFTPVYTANQYFVTFLVNGEQYSSGQQTYGTAIQFPADPTLDHFTFAGWDNTSATVTGHLTINATWSGPNPWDVNGVTYQPWTSTIALPTEGNYYLLNEVQLMQGIELTGDLNLLLNGNKINAMSTIRGAMISLAGQTLTITGGNLDNNQLVTGANVTSMIHAGFDSTVNLNNVKLIAYVENGANDTQGIAINATRSNINLTGSVIDSRGNNSTAFGTNGTGSAIYMNFDAGACNLVLNDCTMIGGVAYRGACIYSVMSNVTIGNSTLLNGSATRGGNIYLQGHDQINVPATLTLNAGATVTSGTAYAVPTDDTTGNGGNICAEYAWNIVLNDGASVIGGSANAGADIALYGEDYGDLYACTLTIESGASVGSFWQHSSFSNVSIIDRR